MPIVNAFSNVKRKPLFPSKGIAGMDDLRRVAAMEIGTGSKSFKADQGGIWLGADKFADALFSVDMLGALIAKSATFKNEDDTTFIDAKGLVSAASFAFDSVVSVQNSRVTSSTSFVDVPNTSLDFTLAREARVLLLMYADIGPATFGDEDLLRALISLDIDGTNYPNSGVGFGTVYNIIDSVDADVGYTRARTAWHGHYVASLATGDHTAKLRFSRTVGDTVNAEIINTLVTYIALGK